MACPTTLDWRTRIDDPNTAINTRRMYQGWAKWLEVRPFCPSDAQAARRAGASVTRFNGWLAHEAFKAEVERARRKSAVFTPPDPGTFESWRLKYVNLKSTNPFTQREGWVGTTYDFQRPFVEALQDDSRRFLLTLLPVRHGKTTLVEQFVVYTLCRNPNARIILVCASLKHAKERAYAIQQMLMDEDLYPELHENWGKWISKGVTWGLTEFRVRGRKDAQRSPSVSCFGVTSKTYGARADIIILDDVDDPTNEPQARENILRAIHGPIITRLAEGGKMIAIGTRCGPDDVYGVLMGRPGWWVDCQSALKESGEALCPELYTLDELEFMRQNISEQEFRMMFLNEPAGIEGSLFPADLVERSKGIFGVGEAPEDWERITAIDPAPAGRCAVVTLAHNPENGEMRVIDCEVRLASGYDGMLQMLRRQGYAHHPKAVVIEAQGGSLSLADVPQIQDVLTYELGGISCIPFHTTGQSKNDPTYGPALIRTLMQQSKLRIAWAPYRLNEQDMRQAQQDAQATMRPLVDDLIGYRPTFTSKKRYDSVMALWFAVKTLTEDRMRSMSAGRRILDPLLARRPFLRNRRARLAARI